MSQQIPPSMSSHWWLRPEISFLLILILIGHVLRLETLPARGEESRRASIAAEMVRTGKYWVSYQQGIPNYSRPPLQYWVIAAFGQISGRFDLWAARLPSVLATLLTAVVVFGYASQFMSRLGAFAAASAFLTMGQILKLGGMAETEAIFTFLVSSSLLMWHWGYTQKWSPSRLWMTAYTLAALATLAKGTQGPVYFLGSVGVFLLVRGNWRCLVSVGHLHGLITYLIVLSLWLVPFYLEAGPVGLKMVFSREATNRFVIDQWLDYSKHLALFPLEIIGCLAPWSLLLSAFAFRSFRQSIGTARPMVTFLLVAVIVTFPTCWLASEARSRYWMPLYPCVAPLIGLVLQRCATAAVDSVLRRTWERYFLATGLGLVGVVNLAVVDWASQEVCLPYSQLLSPLTGFVLAMTGLIGLLLRFRRSASEYAAWIPVMTLSLGLSLGYSVWFLDSLLDKSVDHAGDMAQVRELLAEEELVSYGQVNHVFSFYYAEPIPRRNLSKANSSEVSTYFCFDNQQNIHELPFAWQTVAIVHCDRTLRSDSPNIVIIGHRIEEESTR